jgi:multiple sugar transport system permease protein
MEYGIKPLGREKLYLWLMLLPTMIGLLFGTIGSLLATLGLSLFDWDLINPPTWAGVSNYVALFQNKDYIEAFVNTLKFAALYVPGVVIISLLLAVLLNRKIRGVGFFRTVFFLPAVTSAVATALVWNMIYGKETGILNFMLESLGFPPVCWLCTDNAMMSVIIVNV